jgi:hypothetical protein
MIGIGKPIQFRPDAYTASAGGDFVGFSVFAAPSKAKSSRAALTVPRTRVGGNR